jgi:hypothetical protein
MEDGQRAAGKTARRAFLVGGSAAAIGAAAAVLPGGHQKGALRLTDASYTGSSAYIESVGPYTVVSASQDQSGETDSSDINEALEAASPVLLASGVYYVNTPIVIPDSSCLMGANPSWGIPTGDYGIGGLPLQGAIIRPGTGFSGSAVITMGSTGTTQHGGQRIYSLTIDGQSGPAGMHGIQSVGYVGGVKLRDVVVWQATGDGLHCDNAGVSGHNPDFWMVESCKFSASGGWGVNINGMADSWFTDCESTGNTSGGWSVTAGADTRWIGCRGSSNESVPGWRFKVSGFGGSWQMIGCEANSNGTGILVLGAGAGGTLYISSCMALDNTAAPWESTSTNFNIKSDAAYNTSTGAPTLG